MATVPKEIPRGKKILAEDYNVIVRFVRAITPRGDMKTIRVNQTPGGSTISRIGSRGGGTANSESGDTYKGYFKIIQDGETFNIVDGADPEAVNCGYVIAGNSRIAVPKVSGLSVGTATNGAFYLETTYTTSYQVSIKFATSLPAAANGTDIKLIADLVSGELAQRLYTEHVITRWV